MVSEKKPFSPTDYEELMDPQNHEKRVVLNENNVFAYLESLGYDSSKILVTIQALIHELLRCYATPVILHTFGIR